MSACIHYTIEIKIGYITYVYILGTAHGCIYKLLLFVCTNPSLSITIHHHPSPSITSSYIFLFHLHRASPTVSLVPSPIPCPSPIGLRPEVSSFFIYVLTLLLTVSVASSLAFAISAVVRLTSVANLLVALVFVFAMVSITEEGIPFD